MYVRFALASLSTAALLVVPATTAAATTSVADACAGGVTVVDLASGIRFTLRISSPPDGASVLCLYVHPLLNTGARGVAVTMTGARVDLTRMPTINQDATGCAAFTMLAAGEVGDPAGPLPYLPYSVGIATDPSGGTYCAAAGDTTVRVDLVTRAGAWTARGEPCGGRLGDDVATAARARERPGRAVERVLRVRDPSRRLPARLRYRCPFGPVRTTGREATGNTSASRSPERSARSG